MPPRRIAALLLALYCISTVNAMLTVFCSDTWNSFVIRVGCWVEDNRAGIYGSEHTQSTWTESAGFSMNGFRVEHYFNSHELTVSTPNFNPNFRTKWPAKFNSGDDSIFVLYGGCWFNDRSWDDCYQSIRIMCERSGMYYENDCNNIAQAAANNIRNVYGQ